MKPDDTPTAREVTDLAALLTIKIVQSLSDTPEIAEDKLEDIAGELATWAGQLQDKRVRSLVLAVADVLMATEEGSDTQVRRPDSES